MNKISSEKTNKAQTQAHIEQLPIPWAGRFLYAVVPYRRRVVLANIDQVYGETLNAEQKTHLAKAFYSHIATALKEFVLMRFISQKKLRTMVEVRGHEHLLAVAAQKKGVLVVTGHFGNWEMAPIGGILNFTEFQGQFHFIRRVLVNKFFERLVFKDYTEVGLNVIPQKHSLQRICDVLEQNHAVVFVLDQHASLRNRDGIAVEFFGKKVFAPTLAAKMVLTPDIETFIVPAKRVSGGFSVKYIPFKPVDTDVTNTIRDIYKVIEESILEAPEQYYWSYDRFRVPDHAKQA